MDKSKNEMESGAEETAESWSARVPSGCSRPLGAALVAMLRSQVEGARAVAFEIEGVAHEFDARALLWEPACELALALRSMPFDLGGLACGSASLDVQGPCEAKASDLALSVAARFLGDDRVLARVPAGARLRATLSIERGRGMRLGRSGALPGARVLPSAAGSSRWELDALFSPILDVRFEGGSDSELRSYGAESLTVFLRSDGSMEAKEAIERAASELARHLANWSGEALARRSPEKAPEPVELADPRLSRSLDALGLSVRALNCLRAQGVSTLGRLAEMSARELLRAPNMGRKSLSEVEEALAALGLALKASA